MQLSGAQIIVQSLKAEGVEYVFGYPGGAVIESTMPCSNSINSNTFLPAMSRRQYTRQMRMRASAVRWAWHWLHPARALPMR